MVDLGKYAGAVLSAYGVSVFLLVAIVLQSWLRGRKVRAALKAFEATRSQSDG